MKMVKMEGWRWKVGKGWLRKMKMVKMFWRVKMVFVGKMVKMFVGLR